MIWILFAVLLACMAGVVFVNVRDLLRANRILRDAGISLQDLKRRCG